MPRKTKPKIESWKDLEVWQLAHELVLRVYRVTRDFPSEERFHLTDQLRRAAASVPTNIAEGKGRSSLKEYLQFLSISRGSVEETKYLLLLARDLDYIDTETYSSFRNDYERVSQMICRLMDVLRSHLRR